MEWLVSVAAMLSQFVDGSRGIGTGARSCKQRPGRESMKLVSLKGMPNPKLIVERTNSGHDIHFGCRVTLTQDSVLRLVMQSTRNQSHWYFAISHLWHKKTS